MSYPRYESYKDSGVEWLGEIPSGWEVGPLKRCSVIFNGSTPRSGDVENWDGDILWATPKDLSRVASNYIKTTDRQITDAGLKSSNLTLLPQGSVILSTRAPIGSIAINLEPMTFNQGCRGIVPTEVDARYTYYALLAGNAELNVRGQGTTFLELSTEMLSSFPVSLPPKGEQKAIADFLDEKTAQIDQLIEKKEKLLELLAEKRTALITLAVTKGLDPTAPMKPSGIEWLGDVPEGWELIKLRFLCNIRTGSRDTENRVPNGKYPFFVRSQKIENINSYALDTEAVLTAGDGVGVGKVFHYFNGKFDYHQRVYAFTDFHKISGKFFFHFFSQFFDIYSAKSTVDSVRRPFLQELFFCVPPKDQQNKIVNYVEKETKYFEKMESKVENAISKLKEYRSALITNAVTGKIKVT